MSHFRDFHEPDPYLDDCDEDTVAVTTCKRCGKMGLHWEDDGDGHFVLMETAYRIHKCDENRLHAAVADEFEVLA